MGIGDRVYKVCGRQRIDPESMKIPLNLEAPRMIGLYSAIGASVRLEKMISTRLL
jgi:hypothetical protein